MRHEISWEGLEPILKQRQVCIREGGANSTKARADFATGRVRYYTFPLGGEDTVGTGNEVIKVPKRGYARFLQDPTVHALILDFISPYSETQAWESVIDLAAKTKGVAEIWVPYDNSPNKIKERMVEKGKMNLNEVIFGLQHHVYACGEKNIWAIDPTLAVAELPIPEEVKL